MAKAGGKPRNGQRLGKTQPTNTTFSRKAVQKDAGRHWYNNEISLRTADSPASPALVKKLREKTEHLYKTQVGTFRDSLAMSKSDKEWFAEVTAKGTLKDKLAAYAMAVQDGPFYSLEHLGSLLALASSENRHESLAASESLTDVLVGNEFLPGSRKLFYLHQRPLSDDSDERHLVVWYFEDRLKSVFFSFLKVLEKLMQDNIEHNRETATRLLFMIVQSSPVEQQANTFPLLANKLGDPNKKLSSRIIYYFEKICSANSHVTLAVIRAVKEVLSRPTIPERAQYYGMTFFTQVNLDHRQADVISELVSIFMVFFKSVVVPAIVNINKRKRPTGGKKVKVEDQSAEPPRLCRVILLGINRMMPFVSGDDEAKQAISQFVEPLLKLCKLSNIETSIFALTLLHHVTKITGNPLHQSLFFSQLTQLVSDWLRLQRFSNSYSPLFRLLYVIIEDEQAGRDSQLERLAKRLLNSAVHLDSYFAILSLKWLSVCLERHPRLGAAITIPPENTCDVRNSSLFELAGLCKSFDVAVSRGALSILNSEPFPDIDDVEDACSPQSFIGSLSSLKPKKGTIGNIVNSINSLRKKTVHKNKKGGISDGGADSDIDDEPVDSAGSSAGSDVEIDSSDIGSGDLERDPSDDDMEFMSEDEADGYDGGVFESANESESE